MTKQNPSVSRRALLRGSLLGAGAVGLRAFATGLPASWILGQRQVRAQDAPPPQYLILSTSQLGDPLNANCPGSYVTGVDSNPLPGMEATNVQLGSQTARAAACWGTLPAELRARMAFFHHRTYSNAHPEHRKVMALQGAAKSLAGNGTEMLPSLFAQELSQAIGTIQTEPVPLGGELLTFGGRALDAIQAIDLKGLFDQPDAFLTDLIGMRDRDLDAIYGDLRSHGTRAQRTFLDRYALGRDQVRQLGEQLGTLLARLPTDPQNKASPNDQVIAAVALMKLKVAPVVTMHLPFGGDNHNDSDLSNEAADTIAATSTIGLLWQELNDQGLQDQVSFGTLNVFGRTLKRNGAGGRNHNQNHHVMMMFGKHIKGGVIGGLQPLAGDFAARGIDSATGKADDSGDITPLTSLESAAKTLGAALALPDARLDQRINGGKVVKGVIV
jgi:uncharacterized protein (DUF1501 family)